MHLGNKLRRMRQARGLTAVELAQRARVTTGFISQLEHSQTVPSLQTLQRIAAVLGVSLTYFFLEEHLQPQVVRQQERQIIHLGHDGSCVSLLSPRTSRHLELALFELPSGAVSWSTARAHAGQQCYLLVQGTVRADYGDNTYHLEEGDSILWEGTLPYRLENIGSNEARLLIATAPASLWKQAEEETSNGTATPAPADSLSA
ncbi:MAG TPA: helix-turn-helix domain-containing protein [Candidatus Tectomicrobia bacterium]